MLVVRVLRWTIRGKNVWWTNRGWRKQSYTDLTTDLYVYSLLAGANIDEGEKGRSTQGSPLAQLEESQIRKPGKFLINLCFCLRGYSELFIESGGAKQGEG